MTETERLKVAARDMLRAEGERRATAAIVADLRAMSALYSTGLPSVLAARYETGEHLAAKEQETPNE
jgi:hypothetical protein